MALVQLRLRDAFVRVLGALVMLTVCGAADTPPSSDIGGTGHIEPRGGLVILSAPAGVTIRSIKVHAGQMVKRGDVLMLLDDTQPRLEAKTAATALDGARRDAALMVLGEEVSLKTAILQYQQAKQSADGYRSLGPDNTSLRQRQAYDAALESARGVLALERQKTSQIRAAAAAEVETAANHLSAVQNTLAHYQMTAPSDGIILMVSQHEGEVSAGGPMIELGDVSQMNVICQVFQGDLLKVRAGMKATITSNAMHKTLTGTVVSVSRLIVPTTQTGDVKIKLDDVGLTSRLVGMEVEVKILL